MRAAHTDGRTLIGAPCATHLTNGRGCFPSSSLVPQTDMQNVRRAILYLSSVIGVWVAVSFGGAMVDSGNAAFWSSSLMWSLLAFLVVMPALAMVTHASTAQRQAQQRAAQASSSEEEEKMFVDEEDEVRTLWPEPNHENEWPTQETRRELEQSQSERVSAR